MTLPFVEFNIILVVEPLGLGVGVDPELLRLLPQRVAVVPRVPRYLKNRGAA